MRLIQGLVPALFFFPTVGLLVAVSLPSHSVSVTKQSRQGVPITLPAVCGTVLAGPCIDGSLPVDVEGGLRQKNLSIAQRAANIFSWQEFLALNWPAMQGQRGQAALNLPITTAGPRLWETWKETQEVYCPTGAEPVDWNAPPPQHDARQSTAPAEASSDIHLLTSALQAVQADGTLSPTLTDRHGHLVRYEVRMNRVLFDFIRQNILYDGRKQAELNSISFPNGSMLIKASWREMEKGEEARFLTTDAWLYDVKNGKQIHWRRRKMGLVGFHIVQKTPSAPQWIWSTFEQVDNVSGQHASFSARSSSDRFTNEQTKPGVPNQVTRVLPISTKQSECNQPLIPSDNVQAINQVVQKELARQQSVLRYYELVDTQWPLPPSEGTIPESGTVFRAQPPVVANTTMETFAQDTSSCMGCHAMARSSRKARFVSADFTFTLANAQPVLSSVRVLPPPDRPGTDWDRQNWSSIQRGKELTEHTYELLPQFVRAKLHCASCHTDAGRNPDSAWWVGMETKYPTLEKLEARVNQCFERSMNGHPIPTAPNDLSLAQNAPDMNAFLNYMRWMDEQYQTKNPLPPHNGLAVLPPLTGDPAQGQEIFLQKCAVCHGKEGAGRYEHNTYFRPALWGENSFNSLAGLYKLEKMAAFIKTNMPFGSGGELTTQEAWNLAAFLHVQQRPKN